MRRLRVMWVGLTLLALTVACSGTVTRPIDSADAPVGTAGETSGNDEAVARPAGWTEATHSNDVDPDYGAVFPENAVNTLTITIAPEQWATMQANIADILGKPGSTRRPEGTEPPGDFTPPAEGERPEGTGGNINMVSETPMWVEATIEMDGNVWTNVGIRYKGNSSLTSAWRSSSQKLPFKLDFDEFEETYPAIDNQRFFGFQQLSFANGFSDPTYLRETLTYDVMREAGLLGSRTGLYHIILDYGEGPVDLGIYTAVEVVDDTVIENAFGDDSGNIYEAEGEAASLAEGTSGLIAGTFQKENNEEAADWSDIEALYTALHAGTRTTDPAQWRAGLEAVFDVDIFLNWLAVSAVVQNWDTYGSMSHNYYLYNNPETNQLVWIPWDHNMTFSERRGMGTGRAAAAASGGDDGTIPSFGGGNVSFDKAEVSEQWPLIRFLLDDPVYQARYRTYLAQASEQFDARPLIARIEALATRIRPIVAATSDEATFDAAVTRLIETVRSRDEAVAEFLAE